MRDVASVAVGEPVDVVGPLGRISGTFAGFDGTDMIVDTAQEPVKVGIRSMFFDVLDAAGDVVGEPDSDPPLPTVPPDLE